MQGYFVLYSWCKYILDYLGLILKVLCRIFRTIIQDLKGFYIRQRTLQNCRWLHAQDYTEQYGTMKDHAECMAIHHHCKDMARHNYRWLCKTIRDNTGVYKIIQDYSWTQQYLLCLISLKPERLTDSKTDSVTLPDLERLPPLKN